MSELRSRARAVREYFAIPRGDGDVRMTPKTHPDQYINPHGLPESEVRYVPRSGERRRVSSFMTPRWGLARGALSLTVGVVLLAYDKPGVPFVIYGVYELVSAAWSFRSAWRAARSPRRADD